MKISILQIAKTKDTNLLALEEEFEKRTKSFAKIQSQAVPASKSDDPQKSQQEEAKSLLKNLDPRAYKIALTPDAKQLTSTKFAELIKEQRDYGLGHIQFIIGGSHGLHPDVLAAADLGLSFSKMTFTHEMIRVFLKEQIYRAFTIMAGKRYHK
jgi:23S rRNA (pseudouridine1915-N3)-methyltransferase